MGNAWRTGYDPERSKEEQVILDTAFISKKELENLTRVYPEVLRDEFWEVIDQNTSQEDIWRVRPTKGFGY